MVWRKSNPMPNFRGRRFTNAHETLIWAAREPGKSYTFNYEALKAGNDDVQVRSDWTIPLCTGEERLKDGDGKQAASDPEAGSPARPRDPVGFAARTTSCSTRSSAPARPGPLRRASAGGSSASNAMPPMPQRPRRASRRSSRCRSASLAPFMTAREAPRVPFAALLERGLIAPGQELYCAKRRHAALVRADGALAYGGKCRLDPPDRRARAGARGLQRLDLLARRDPEGPRRHRHAARQGARRDGGVGTIHRLSSRPIRGQDLAIPVGRSVTAAERIRIAVLVRPGEVSSVHLPPVLEHVGKDVVERTPDQLLVADAQILDVAGRQAPLGDTDYGE